jgi:hypothetical protein
MYRAMLEQTPCFPRVTTAGGRSIRQIAAGQGYVRAILVAARLGPRHASRHQAPAGVPEMEFEFSTIHRRLGVAPAQRIQMLARVGYAAAVDASARWPLDAKLKPS